MGITGGYQISTRNTEEGIVDNCTQVLYNGGMSGFVRDDYVDFSGYTGGSVIGVIHSWVRFDVPPIADFVYTFETGIPNRYIFTDASRYFADTWEWTVDGTVSSNGRVFAKVFPTGMFGQHIIGLTSSNAAGSTEKHKVVTSY
jgi:PKD repeat protein